MKWIYKLNVSRVFIVYHTDMSQPGSSHMLVAAFDFGTTYSGYAFSFHNDPLKVQINQSWVAGTEQLISLKTSTCVLLDPDRNFHSFGFQAENKYADLALEEKHHDWMFFRRFKMLLHNNEVCMYIIYHSLNVICNMSSFHTNIYAVDCWVV